MKDSSTYLLFDVDGVIIAPLAYIAGVQKTLELLCAQVGLSDSATLLPTRQEIACMESVGVHDVWDMTNIMFARILCAIAASGQDFTHLLDRDSVEEKLAALARTQPTIERPSYEAIADLLAREAGNPHPPDVAIALFRHELEKTISQQALPGWLTLLDEFLLGTRNPYQSYGTRLFQNIILGSQEFTATYDLKSRYDGKSLLQSHDRVIITPESVNKVLDLLRSGQGRAAVYTARPSYPPNDAVGSRRGYSPEAELALESAGMLALPLVGMGMMEWLAAGKGERPEDLTKPNTTQALASLLACATGESVVDTLEQAYRIDKLGDDPDHTAFAVIKDTPLTVFVFEDTISGIVPMLDVSQKLNQAGWALTFEPLGIASDTRKKEALQHWCRYVFDDVNQALEHALGQKQQSR